MTEGKMVIDIKLSKQIIADIEVCSDVFRFHMPASIEKLKLELESALQAMDYEDNPPHNQ